MKYEWKKAEKDIYLPKEKPTLIDIPKMNFFVVDGKGDPNTSLEFQEDVAALYSLSYSIKMSPKSGKAPNGYFDYTVYPLEGVWDIADKEKGYSKFSKDNLIYSIMIRQPVFVTNELAEETISKVSQKKPNKSLIKVKFNTYEEGLCVQMMHIGSYDDEKKTFDIMEQFCEENNLIRLSYTHREIYLSDQRKVVKDKMKTVLRFMVKHK